MLQNRFFKFKFVHSLSSDGRVSLILCKQSRIVCGPSQHRYLYTEFEIFLATGEITLVQILLVT
jgi:hypothetical protein